LFLPIGDAPNPRFTPIVTWSLIAVNVVAYLLLNVPLGSRQADIRSPGFRDFFEYVQQQQGQPLDPRWVAERTSAYEVFTFAHGYRPAAPELSDLLSCMFLHGSFMHLFGNMLFLWIYGDNVERRLGTFPFLFWDLLTGVAATLTHGLVFASSSPNTPLVGASGAISGVLGFYFLWFPRNVVRILAFLPPFLMQVFEVPARIVLGIFLVWDNLVPALFSQGGGVAHGAHIGGFVAGLGAAWLMDRRGVATRPKGFAAASSAPTGGEAIRKALAEGRTADAASAYFALSPAQAQGAVSAEEAVELARWLRANGHAQAALVLLRRIVRDRPRGRGLAEVYAAAGTLLLEDLHEPTAAYQYLLSALELGPSPETEATVRRALREIEELQKRRVGRPRSPRPW